MGIQGPTRPRSIDVGVWDQRIRRVDRIRVGDLNGVCNVDVCGVDVCGVGACRIAVEKAGDRLPGSGTVIGASDAFFPFDDGPRVLLDAGVTCLVHTGGSKRDSETIALCEERGVTCLLTGVRHFRH